MSRRAAKLVVRPLLIIILFLVFARRGHISLSVPFALLLIVVSTAIVYCFGRTRAHEHYRSASTASLDRGDDASGDPIGAGGDEELPPTPLYIDQDSLLPPGYNARSDTSDKVMSFVHRMFEHREPEHD